MSNLSIDLNAAATALKEDATAQQYLQSRGISLEVAEKYGVGVVDRPSIGKALSFPYNAEAVKFRSLAGKEFRHLPGCKTSDLLFGIDQLPVPLGDVIVSEGELDAVTLASHGHPAVSVTSANASVASGIPKIQAAHIAKLASATRIFIATDMDTAGQQCADALIRVLPSEKTFRIEWQYDGKESGDPKDIGEVYKEAPDRFNERIEELKHEAASKPPKWRKLFKSYPEMDTGDETFVIKGFLPEGITFIGALPDSGKTWLGLSMSKALTTGERFLGVFEVPEKVPVLYMIPESGEKAFRKRMAKMGLTEESFLCRTIGDGSPLPLNDPLLVDAVRQLRPVIFLDTAIRFAEGEENSASDNDRGLAKHLFGLRSHGARAIVGLHHAPKALEGEKAMTLATVLRGTSDYGAMCDAVYGVRRTDKNTLRLRLECVKARDFEAPLPFTVQGKPYIDEKRDFVVLTGDEPAPVDPKEQALIEAIRQTPKATYKELTYVSHISQGKIKAIAEKHGWRKSDGLWKPLETTEEEPNSPF